MYLHSWSVATIFNNVTTDDVLLPGEGGGVTPSQFVSVHGNKRRCHQKGTAGGGGGQLNFNDVFIHLVWCGQELGEVDNAQCKCCGWCGSMHLME